jgi:hypothetical protein
MSETIELPKPKRVYKKKATPIQEPIVTPIQEPVIEPIAIPELCVTPHTTDGGLGVSPNIKEKKPRSQKQIEAFNRMREAKQKKKQEKSYEQIVEPEPEPIVEPEPVIQIPEPIKPKKTYKKKEPQQVYIDARTINTAKPESYNEPPVYTPQNVFPQKIQEKTFRPYIFV